MTINNLPWKYSQIKSAVGYRNWEILKNVTNQKKRQSLLDSYKSGKKVLFIHIPKTAGVSLIKTYEEYFADARHSPALLYKYLLGKKYQQFTTFSIVRNPWARIFSAYNFLKNGGLGGTDQKMGEILLQQCPSFEHFIKEWLPQKGVCCYGHFVPQYEFVCGLSDDDIIVDHLVKIEGLDSDWPIIANALGMPLRDIPRINTSAKKDFRRCYDNESIDVVNRIYKKDVKLFNYSF